MSRNRIILLVEDNPDDAALAVRAFAKADPASQIVVADDGQAALEMLLGDGSCELLPSLPRMVLLDLKLPKVDGFAVLRRLRADERTRRLPVIVMTSSDEQSDVSACYDLGANSFVRKPIDYAEFLETARELDHYWLELNEPPPAEGCSG